MVSDHAAHAPVLGRLLEVLKTEVTAATEFLVRDETVEIPCGTTTALCFGVCGIGRVLVGGAVPRTLSPNLVLVVPRGQSLAISKQSLATRYGGASGAISASAVIAEPSSSISQGQSIGGEEELGFIYLPFRAFWGQRLDLFATLRTVITEDFTANCQVRQCLKAIVEEQGRRRIGAEAMAAALVKQILIIVLRRSLTPGCVWARHMALLSDELVARAFSEMVALPGAPHSIASLSRTAGLSRSAFIARFIAALGDPPVSILRQLRMQHAADLFKASNLTIDQIALTVGYSSRASFIRAYRHAQSNGPLNAQKKGFWANGNVECAAT
jgi:AraC family transcriptional activator of mtrCDE